MDSVALPPSTAGVLRTAETITDSGVAGRLVLFHLPAMRWSARRSAGRNRPLSKVAAQSNTDDLVKRDFAQKPWSHPGIETLWDLKQAGEVELTKASGLNF